MTTPPTEPRRKPKGDKRVRTRAALLAAARELVREKGYARTTLEDVAARAGMTTGAIYGNFRNREELFIALGDTYWPPIKPRVALGATFADAMRAMAAATIAALPDRSVVVVGRLTGMAYALEHPELRQRVQQVTAASYDMGAAWLETLADGRDLPMPKDHLVRVIHALIEGLVVQRLLTPDLFPDEVIYAAFGALAAAPRPSRAPSPTTSDPRAP
jgi:AcrR family transcriptional regulator